MTTSMNKVEKARADLTLEAKALLNSALGHGVDIADERINRAVDCIIIAAALTSAKWQAEAMNDREK